MVTTWIFDLDDTLVRSEPVWHPSEVDLYRHLGFKFDADFVANYKGKNAMEVARSIRDHVGSEVSVEECGAFLRSSLIRYSRTPGPEIIAGATRLLERVYPRRALIASGSPRPVIDTVVEHFAWGELLHGWISTEEVPAGKPAPDVFLEAARRAGVVADECVVVEDSRHGVRAVRAAGMRCVGVPRTDSREICGEVDWCVHSLDDIDPPEIEAEAKTLPRRAKKAGEE